MKKMFIPILAAICALGLTACGNWLEGARLDADISEDEIKSWIEDAE